MGPNSYFVGIDVGTGSARAGVFDAAGVLAGAGQEPIALFAPGPDLAQQSSADIWRAICVAVRAAMAAAAIPASSVAGVGVDATCSLVAVGADDRPVSISPDGAPDQDVIVWMDHRAIDQAARIDATRHPLLRFTGGRMSPEMQLPKLMWLAEYLPDRLAAAEQLFDLPDWITWRATGARTRSLCSATCKWTYQGKAGLSGEGWDGDFLSALGLAALARDGFAPIGNRFAVPGAPVGGLTDSAAAALGLAPGTPVAASLIDAYAGALGTLAATGSDGAARLALIAGTSACHIVAGREARFVPGVWGPYLGALTPGDWANEAGQSAAGALIDRVIAGHAAAGALRAAAAGQGAAALSAALDARLLQLAPDPGALARLTRDRHVLPDFHGNRSPLADPEFRGAITGLTLDCGIDDLAITYLATIQALAYGTRQIVEGLAAAGISVTTLVVSGGLAQNRQYLQAHADATGCDILVPAQSEPVLLGGAMLGAVAAGRFADLAGAQRAMSGPAALLQPQGPDIRAYHDTKYQVFLRMQDDFRAARALMHADRS